MNVWIVRKLSHWKLSYEFSGGAQEEKLAQHYVDGDEEEDRRQMAIALSLQEEGGNKKLQKGE